jgi:carbamoyl-phosphate synthase large subunit
MNTILITGIGGDIGQAVAKIARELLPNAKIFGSDLHNRHAGAHYVDKFILAPPAISESYLTWLESVVADNLIDLTIPLSEIELIRINNRGLNQASEVKFLMPSSSAIRVGIDKLQTAIYLESIGCPVPWTISAKDSTHKASYPCVFKPRCGAGSKGVFLCNGPEDVAQMLRFYPDAVLQELLLPAEQEITCGVYRAKDGQIAVVQMLRQLAGDVTGWVEVVYHPEVEEQCVLIAESLCLNGSINVQLRVTDLGPRIFEINPRFSSTVLIRHLLGFQDAVWSLREAMGEKITIQRPRIGTRAVRIQDAALL